MYAVKLRSVHGRPTGKIAELGNMSYSECWIYARKTLVTPRWDWGVVDLLEGRRVL